MSQRTASWSLLAVLALLVSACGGVAAGDVVATGRISAKKASVSLVDRAPVAYRAESGDIVEVIEVRLSMFEFGYGPEVIEVPVGATVRFIFDNDGAIEHEAIIGDMATQQAQRRDSAASADDHDEPTADDHDEPDEPTTDNHDEPDEPTTDDHDEPSTDDHDDHGDVPVLVLAGGASGDLVVGFDEVGEFLIGCHIPGHWESGMRATINVVEPSPSDRN